MTHKSTAAGNTTQAVPATAGEAADAGDAAGRVCRTAPLLLIALPLVFLGYGLAGWSHGWALGVDSSVYRGGAALLLHGHSPYDVSGLGYLRLSFTYPPSAALLFIAAQTGFFGGPRVLANMAVDRWMPTRFATLSDRLVTQNGVILMGLAALLVVCATKFFATGGLVDTLVVLYSINVFITFSLSQLGMVRHWWLDRRNEPRWKRKIAINGFGLMLTSGILISLCIVKFTEGGWATLLVTGVLIGIAFWVKSHYRRTQKRLHRLTELVAAAMADEAITAQIKAPPPCDTNARTAVMLVNGFNGLGLHTLMAVIRMFPKVYTNFVFVQVGVLDAGNFKGASEVENLREHSQKEVTRYVTYVGKRGFYSESHIALGTDIVDEAAKLCDVIADKFPQAQFFAGQLVFKDESLMTRWVLDDPEVAYPMYEVITAPEYRAYARTH